MSLIFDAMRQIEAERADPAAAALPPRARLDSRRLLPVALAAGVAAALVAAGAAWLWPAHATGAAETAMPADADPAADRAPHVAQAPVAAPAGDAATVRALAPAVPIAAAAGPAPGVAPVPAPEPEPERETDAPAAPASVAALTAREAADAGPTATAPSDADGGDIRISVSEAAPAPAPAAGTRTEVVRHDAARERTEDPDEPEIQRRVAAAGAAIASGDAAAVHDALDALAQVLPAESLTLLRMRAWAAYSAGDFEAAGRHYREVVARVPDDLNAGINVALLDARAGELERARTRLMRLQGRNGGSRELARALAMVEGAHP